MCGIFGMFGNPEAARLTYLGLYALQHRGEESAGIVSYDGKSVHHYKRMGLVSDVFTEDNINRLKGCVAIGHVRYSTTGSSITKNVQPFIVDYKKGHIAIVHNGNFVNTLSLRESLEDQGAIFQTTMDSEIAVHLLARCGKKDVQDKVVETLAKIEGAYSLILMIDNMLVAARDPYGWRPLVLGRVKDSYVVASETCALDLIQAEYLREIEPGEAVFIDKNGVNSIKFSDEIKRARCIFEHIYFSRPDSVVFGQSVYSVRKRLGERLAEENPVSADIVTPVPDSGNYAALGFAQKSKIPLEMGVVRNHYVGRTFIQPSQFIRDFRVKVKLNPVKNVFKGKRVVIIEDSIVRGTTTKMRIRTIKQAGAKEVHMRVSCPPLKFPCFYGIDFPTKKELIASKFSVEEIRKF